MFETEHLRIRSFRQEDARRLYENHREEALRRWFPNESYEDMEEAQKAIRFYAERVEQKRFPYVLAVEWKQTGELIGDAGASRVGERENQIEIGYSICQKYSGKGYATELLRALTEFLTSTLGITEFYGRVLHGNNASVRVLEKCGYRFVGEEFGAEDDPYGHGVLVYKKES